MEKKNKNNIFWSVITIWFLVSIILQFEACSMVFVGGHSSFVSYNYFFGVSSILIIYFISMFKIGRKLCLKISIPLFLLNGFLFYNSILEYSQTKVFLMSNFLLVITGLFTIASIFHTARILIRFRTNV